MALFLSLVFVTDGYSQSVQTLAAPDIVRTGAYTSTRLHALHATANQAALGGIKQFTAALYGEKRFLLQEFSTCYLALAQPAGDGAFGVQIAYTGNADFNTTKLGFAYGKRLSKMTAVGVQFNYQNQHIRGYGNAAQVTAAAGLLFHFSETVHVGFQACDVAGVSLAKGHEKTPGAYTLGASYQPSQNVSITAELVKVEKVPVAVQGGLEYHFTTTLWAKAGINTSTAAFYVAAGFRLRDFKIEVAGLVHPQLGLSPGTLLAYNAMGK